MANREKRFGGVGTSGKIRAEGAGWLSAARDAEVIAADAFRLVGGDQSQQRYFIVAPRKLPGGQFDDDRGAGAGAGR
jgi:hypothetical protein